ncbi:hypothetical protein D3C81_1777520 [compost metagenome]
MFGIRGVKLHKRGEPKTTGHFVLVSIFKLAIFPRFVTAGIPVTGERGYHQLTFIVKLCFSPANDRFLDSANTNFDIPLESLFGDKAIQ